MANEEMSKIKKAKELIEELDEAFTAEDGKTAKKLIREYTNDILVAGETPADLSRFGCVLLDGYQILSSSSKEVSVDTLDGIFNYCLKALKNEGFSKDIIIAAEEQYNKKRTEVLQYEKAKKSETLLSETVGDLNAGKVVSAIRKGNRVAKLNQISEKEAEDLESKAIASFENKEIKNFIVQYSLAGKNPILYLKQKDPQGYILGELRTKYVENARQAEDRGNDAEFDKWQNELVVTQKLSQLLIKKPKRKVKNNNANGAEK